MEKKPGKLSSCSAAAAVSCKLLLMESDYEVFCKTPLNRFSHKRGRMLDLLYSCGVAITSHLLYITNEMFYRCHNSHERSRTLCSRHFFFLFLTTVCTVAFITHLHICMSVCGNFQRHILLIWTPVTRCVSINFFNKQFIVYTLHIAFRFSSSFRNSSNEIFLMVITFCCSSYYTKQHTGLWKSTHYREYTTGYLPVLKKTLLCSSQSI